MIPEHKIDEVRSRVDIHAVVSRYVELKKSGKSFVGLCPFHGEKTPSFNVIPDLNIFKCYGCGAGGDTIAFVMRYLGKPFTEAIRDLAREAGVDLETAADPAARERHELKQATDLAARHFAERLWDPQRGQVARGYLATRGVSDATAKAFGLGWATPDYGDLCEKLLQEGMLEWGVRAGLAKRFDGRDGFYDGFRSRLMIPIRSPEGRTIGFGGRFLEVVPTPKDRTPPKYLNSRDSLLYNKSEVLFGMDQARDEVRRSKTAVLVEGYFDCIALHDVGVKSAVALCSTALTAQHMALLKRSEAKELVLLLDGDEAGRRAVEKLAGPILASGFASRVALLPDGEDPDTFARREGQAGMQALLSSARPLTAYLFQTVLPGGADSTFEEKMGGLDRLRGVCAQLPVGLVRSAFFGAMSKHFGLPAAELEASLKGKEAPVKPAPKPGPHAPQHASHQAANGYGQGRSAPVASPSPIVEQRPPDRAPDPLELAWVAAVMREPRLLDAEPNLELRVQDELHHSGVRLALQRVASGDAPEDVLHDASEDLRGRLEQAGRQLPASEEALREWFAQVSKRVMRRRVDDKLSWIAKVTAQIQGANELPEDARRLLEQRIKLLELKKKLV